MPSSNKRTTARPAGSGAKARTAQPADPRRATPDANEPRPAASATSNGAGSKPTPSGSKRRTPNTTKASGTPAVTVAFIDVPEEIVDDDKTTNSRAPLPVIVPAEPQSEPELRPGALARPLYSEPIEDRELDLEPDAEPNRDNPMAGVPMALVPAVGVPGEPDGYLPDAPVLWPTPEVSDTDGTDGLPSLLKPIKPARKLRQPVVRAHHRARVRRVTRVVRHVDTWSVFKVAVVFSLFLYGVCLTAGVLLWQVAQNTGTVDNVERFFESFGWQQFKLNGGEIFHNAWIAGLFVVVGLTGLAVLMATLFNLITDLVGGIRVSVLEEEVVAREERGLGWRRSRRRTDGETEQATEQASEQATEQAGIG